jgi:hypothetical protein
MSTLVVFMLLLRGTNEEYWDLDFEITTISHILAYDHRVLYFTLDEGHE